METNNQVDNFNDIESKPLKRPVFLTVLVILTWLWTGIMMMNSFTAMVNGPMDEEKMLDQELKAATSIVEMKDLGQDEFVYMIEMGLERMRYINNEAFYKNYLITLFIAIFGAFSAFLMWNKKKIGFHAYILYSLLFVAMAYFIYPIDMIVNIEIYMNLAISGLFVLLYSRNLKAME